MSQRAYTQRVPKRSASSSLVRLPICLMDPPRQTISTLSSFFLVLLLYPDVQKRAQAEIDEVIGRGRLPGLDDRPSLPYIDGLCKELLRWRLVLPLGVAHATTEDDVYSGYFIPKGTMVLPNTWCVSQEGKRGFGVRSVVRLLALGRSCMIQKYTRIPRRSSRSDFSRMMGRR
jgi:Cytochrome P450